MSSLQERQETFYVLVYEIPDLEGRYSHRMYKGYEPPAEGRERPCFTVSGRTAKEALSKAREKATSEGIIVDSLGMSEDEAAEAVLKRFEQRRKTVV